MDAYFVAQAAGLALFAASVPPVIGGEEPPPPPPAADVNVLGVTLRGAASFDGGLAESVLPPVIIGVNGPRSAARTFVVTTPQVASQDPEIGTFWNMANPSKPKGVKDPDSVLDLPFDWNPWLADAQDTYGSHEFKLTGGLVLVATNHDAGVMTAFVKGGTVGTLAAVTCRIKTNSTPPREEDRTVYLRIKNG